MGEGDPLVISPPLGWSHIQLELAYPNARHWYERLAERRMIVRFDFRANGLSQRNIDSVPPEAPALDIEAVRIAIGIDRMDLMLNGGYGAWAARYPAEHPDRIRRLVLVNVPPDSDAIWGSREVQAAASLADKDWRTFTEALAQSILGWDQPETAHLWARFIRAAISERDFEVLSRQPPLMADPRLTFGAIQAPTLVMYPSRARNMPVAAAQQLTSMIPGARLALWQSGQPAMGVHATDMMEAFLDEGRDVPPRAARSQPEDRRATSGAGTAIILFADIVDSTALTERMGDAAFRERARALDASLRAIITSAGGTAIDGKLLGDGVLATFPAAAQAIDAALRCGAAGDDGGLPLHLGIHAGDVIREQDGHGRDNVFGGAVNIASRISGLSAPGEVLVSDVVRALARTSASVTFEDRGEHALKGVGEPQRVYAVRARSEGG
jgi:class 3 adenylate cyclase